VRLLSYSLLVSHFEVMLQAILHSQPQPFARIVHEFPFEGSALMSMSSLGQFMCRAALPRAAL
jgi:hypothetical protein